MTRLHIACAMSATSRTGQTAVVAVEHRQVAPEEPGKRITWEHLVRHIEQLPAQVEVAAERLIEMVNDVQEQSPTVLVDIGAGPGRALYDILREHRSAGKYRLRSEGGMPVWHPIAYAEQGARRQELLTAILVPYGTDRLRFDVPDEVALGKLTRALALQKATVQDDGVTTTSSDEALVVALGLAMRFARYTGALPAYVKRGGEVLAIGARWADDPYLQSGRVT